MHCTPPRRSADLPRRTVIADDDPLYREFLRVTLTMREAFDVRAVVASGAEAVTAAVEHDAELVLLDLRMPGLDGLAAAREIRSRQPQAFLVLLTGSLEQDVPQEAFEAVDAVIEKMLRPAVLTARLTELLAD